MMGNANTIIRQIYKYTCQLQQSVVVDLQAFCIPVYYSMFPRCSLQTYAPLRNHKPPFIILLTCDTASGSMSSVRCRSTPLLLLENGLMPLLE